MPDSPAFTPPNLQPKDNDPMVAKVPMNKVEWGFREGQAPPVNQDGVPPISHVANGR